MKLLRFILLLVHLAVLFALLAMLLNAYLPAGFTTYTNLLSLAFPVLIFVYLLITLFWIFSWKKRALVFLLLLVLFFNPIRRWVNYSPAQRPGTLKVLTWNTRGGMMGQAEVDGFLRSHRDYDLIFLQEDHTQPFGNSAVFGITKLLTPHKILEQKEILDDGDLGHAFYADVLVGDKIIRAINVYLEPFELDKTMVKPSKSTEQNEQKARRLLHRMLPKFKTHQRQALKIHKLISESPYPVIVAGDFNSVPNSFEYFEISKGLADAFVEAGSGSATSFHDYKFPIRIDYVFCSPQLKPAGYKVERRIHSSDHFPVTASFNFK